MTEIINVNDFFSASDHKLIIRDIRAMYHHPWDIIGESIQNAVDSVLKKKEESQAAYTPNIRMIYNYQTRQITFEDNGSGISSASAKSIAAPHVSFKNPLGANRGEFGVGLTLVAFSSNDFKLETLCEGTTSVLEIKNGYSWSMDIEDNEVMSITFSSSSSSANDSYTKVNVKPVRFPEYTLPQLEYVLRRYTAMGDFWTCYNEEVGPIVIELVYISNDGKRQNKKIENKFWHPADYLSTIGVLTVERIAIKNELDKGKDTATPNWVGFGLVDKDTVTEKGKEFKYYALFCRTNYYKQLARATGLYEPPESDDEEEDLSPSIGFEPLAGGIFFSKKGMPLGAIIDHPKTGQLGYWRGMYIMMNCDDVRTEPGRKKLHVDDEQIARLVVKKVFYKLTEYAHYIIPRDPDAEVESLINNVSKNLESIKIHRVDHKLINPADKIQINVEPLNEQTTIGLFHELIGAKVLLGYKALKLSATDTYDGIYEYEISKQLVGKEYYEDWLRQFKASDRKIYNESGLYHEDTMIVEFKLRLQDIINDFLQKKKYHPHIKLLIAWDADRDAIKRKGWLLEPLPRTKYRFHGATYRLRPSAEGQTKGINATDVLLLKEFLSQNSTSQ